MSAKENRLIFCFEVFQSIYCSPPHEFFRKTFCLQVRKFFHFSLYFFLLQTSFFFNSVHSSWGEDGAFQWGCSPGSPRKDPGLLMCKTCLYFPVAHGLIRKTPGSSTWTVRYLKGSEISSFQMKCLLRVDFYWQAFLGETAWGKGPFNPQNFLCIWLAQPADLTPSSPTVSQKGWRHITHCGVWEIALRGGDRRLHLTLRSLGVPAGILLYSICTPEY